MGKGINIIAIDTDTDHGKTIELIIESLDPKIQVTVVTSNASVKPLIDSGTYDCVVVNRTDPQQDEFLCIQEIRGYCELPIILCVNTELPQNAIEAINEGVTYFSNVPVGNGLYLKLAEKIRHVVSIHRSEQRIMTLKQKKSPRVLVRGENLYIMDHNGEALWGLEEQLTDDVARLMELELKAIDFVRDNLADEVTDLSEVLLESGVPVENIPDIIYEGYRKLFSWFKDLDSSLGQR
ncbi:MAG: hypothetical protein NWE89_08815 [Candidatus Bathyarchaeota archaeon]|nr:hypothetical protein [Candidatus Bathyarchaeota archaeon]